MKIDLRKGDCLELMKDIPNGSVDLILCDLPYGTTQNKWDAVIPFEALWAEYRRVCRKGAAIVLTAAQPFTSALVMSQPKLFKYDWTWKKQIGRGHLNAKKMPLRDKEDILVFYSEQPTYNPQMVEGKPYSAASKGSNRAKNTQAQSNYGEHRADGCADNSGYRYPKQILEFNTIERGEHPTQKPVTLMEYLIRTYTNEGDTVLDNCMGSGTTGVACVNTGRNFIGMEMDAGYFEIAKNRIEAACK